MLVENTITGQVGLEHHRFEKPGGMRQIPFARTCIRHGLRALWSSADKGAARVSLNAHQIVTTRYEFARVSNLRLMNIVHQHSPDVESGLREMHCHAGSRPFDVTGHKYRPFAAPPQKSAVATKARCSGGPAFRNSSVIQLRCRMIPGHRRGALQQSTHVKKFTRQLNRWKSYSTDHLLSQLTSLHRSTKRGGRQVRACVHVGIAA